MIKVDNGGWGTYSPAEDDDESAKFDSISRTGHIRWACLEKEKSKTS